MYKWYSTVTQLYKVELPQIFENIFLTTANIIVTFHIHSIY